MKKSTYWLLVILGFIVASILFYFGKNSFGTTAKVYNTLGFISFIITPLSYYAVAFIKFIRDLDL